MTENPIPVAEPLISGRSRRRSVIGLLISLAVIGGGLTAAVLAGVLPNPLVKKVGTAEQTNSRTGNGKETIITVKVVRPKRDTSVQVRVEQLATVEPYFRADLRARASGLVKAVYKDIGDEVRRGDLLIDIDVPELQKEILQKEAMVGQRRQDLRVAQAHLKDAYSSKEVALALVKQRRAEVTQAEATRDFRKKRYDRYKDLLARGSVVGTVADEEEREYLASVAAVEAAKAATDRARADFNQSDSKIEGAMADIDLKNAMIEVAQRDLERAQVLADYAQVTAPFRGTVIRRNVDPGSFVQNATTGQSETLISIARSDLVTIVAKFPDTVAPFIDETTEAVININDLPGVSILGRVTRYSPSIQNSDRTMRVEVDLINGGEREFATQVKRTVIGQLTGLATWNPLHQMNYHAGYKFVFADYHKGDSENFPALAFPEATADTPRKLLPGMVGSMTLVLSQFQNSFVLPSTAIYSRSGSLYILMVEDGKTKQYPVRVRVNDGRLALVSILGRRKDSAGVLRDVLTELTGQEQIVESRQLEIGEGVPVRVSSSEP